MESKIEEERKKLVIEHERLDKRNVRLVEKALGLNLEGKDIMPRRIGIDIARTIMRTGKITEKQKEVFTKAYDKG